MILIIDNYDSFTYNLVQYVGALTDIAVVRNDDENLEKMAQNADALIFSPGPGWPADAGKMEAMIQEFAGQKPILGICLGFQAIVEVLVANSAWHIRSCMEKIRKFVKLREIQFSSNFLQNFGSCVIIRLSWTKPLLYLTLQLQRLRWMMARLWPLKMKKNRFTVCNFIQNQLGRWMA